MKLKFKKEAYEIPYTLLGQDPREDDIKNLWIFPQMDQTLPSIFKEDKTPIIEPHTYYCTSGEAVRKTEVLIDDIKQLMKQHKDDKKIIKKLTNLLIDSKEFLDLLKETRSKSKYLELTKSEDGIYNGSICARKDPKKKKEEMLDDE
jgi:hypothetical protein